MDVSIVPRETGSAAIRFNHNERDKRCLSIPPHRNLLGNVDRMWIKCREVPVGHPLYRKCIRFALPFTVHLKSASYKYNMKILAGLCFKFQDCKCINSIL